MIRILISLTSIILILAGLGLAVSSTIDTSNLSAWPLSSDVVAGELIVTLAKNGSISPESVPEAQEARIIGQTSRILLKAALRGSESVDQTLILANRLRRNENTSTVDLNYLTYTADTPNDPRYNQQWHLPAIHAPEAWSIQRGSAIVAIVDTGADYTHPDLSPHLLPGHDFANDDDDAQDDQGHGTHVAGVAAAVTDNGIGVAGACWDCYILPIKALDENGVGGHAQISRAIVWAVDQGADVINLSLGSPYTSATLSSAIDYAWSNGVLIVAAAGNSGNTQPMFPAAYERVMAIAGTDQESERAIWSNYGPWISLAAPGETIWSTTRGASYQAWSGTSMASPIVAGAAGLLWTQFPTWSNASIWRALTSSAQPLPEAGLGAGLLDIHAALSTTSPNPPEPDDATPTATEAPTRPSAPTPPLDGTETLLQLINQARAGLGLRPVAADPRLTLAAQDHAWDMATNSFCGHAGSDGRSPYRRMLDAGYPNPLYEVVGCGYASAQSLFDAIMASASPGPELSPRERILAPEAGAIGAGYSHGGGWREMWVINLGGSGEPALPTITPTIPTLTPTPTQTPKPAYCLRCEDVAGPDRCTEIECP